MRNECNQVGGISGYVAWSTRYPYEEAHRKLTRPYWFCTIDEDSFSGPMLGAEHLGYHYTHTSDSQKSQESYFLLQCPSSVFYLRKQNIMITLKERFLK